MTGFVTDIANNDRFFGESVIVKLFVYQHHKQLVTGVTGFCRKTLVGVGVDG